jgi:hypothetical protein
VGQLIYRLRFFGSLRAYSFTSLGFSKQGINGKYENV